MTAQNKPSKPVKMLTLGEMAEVERITGHNFDDQVQPRGIWIAAVVMVLRKRKEPDFTLEDAYDMDANEAGDMISEYFGALADNPK